MRTQTRGALALLLAAAISCAGYKQTADASKSIWKVKVTTNREDVKSCRRVASVDAWDMQRGCGLTVQPTTEECLRYQVVLAGGDTLLANGFVGEAYDCSGSLIPEPTATPKPSPTPSPTPRPSPIPPPSPTVTPSTAPAASTPTPLAEPARGARIVQSRESVKGCVYLDEMNPRIDCPAGDGATRADCVSERAAKAGGNTVLVDGDRALIFLCKQDPRP